MEQCIVFRPAEASDYDEMHRFITRAWIDAYQPWISKRSINRFISEDGTGLHLFFYLETFQVAISGDEVVGTINQAGDYVTCFFVDSKFQNKGFGTRMLDSAAIAGGRYLEVPVFNKSAIAFYERRGWIPVRQNEEDAYGTVLPSFTMQYQQ